MLHGCHLMYMSSSEVCIQFLFHSVCLKRHFLCARRHPAPLLLEMSLAEEKRRHKTVFYFMEKFAKNKHILSHDRNSIEV